MRRVSFGDAGRPTTAALDLEELVLILQGAIESVDAERFVLARDQTEVPDEMRVFARSQSYEVSVVGKFHTLVQRWAERQRLAVVWERPVAQRLAGQGRHPTIDISLFGEASSTSAGRGKLRREVRLEFGFFEIASPSRPKFKRVDHAKLQADAEKLFKLREEARPVPGAFSIENYVLLWRIANERNSRSNLEWYRRALSASASRAMDDSSSVGIKIEHVLTSSVDLIAARTNEHRIAYVGAFQIR